MEMSYSHRFVIPVAFILICSLLLQLTASNESSKLSVYDVLKVHGLPMGLLPKGVKNFTLDDSGKFEVHLDRACNAKFENELHYDMYVSGILHFGQIGKLSGISAQDLFLWFPVIEIRVDIPSSGLIYFNVGVVSKQFSLSLFETPRDCVDGPRPDLQSGKGIAETVSKIRLGKPLNELDQDNMARTSL